MAKIYLKKEFVNSPLKPKKETISFLLDYSKVLNVMKVCGHNFEIMAN